MTSASTRGSVERSSALVGLGLVLTSLLGAGQALILVFIIGPGPETDAFLAAYSAYLPFALFATSLRSSIVPLIGPVELHDGFQPRSQEIVSRVAVLGLAATSLLILIAPLLGWFLTRHGDSAHRSITVLALLLLAPAVYCQIHAGALSGALNALRRFPTSIAIYVAASLLGLISSAALLAMFGVLGAGVGLVFGASVLLALHITVAARLGVGFRLDPRLLRQREERILALRLAAGTASAVSQQLAVVIAISALPDIGPDVTLYVYAYFFVGILLNISVLPLTWVTLPDAVEATALHGKPAAVDHMLALVPVVYALLLPTLALTATFGEVVLQAVFGTAFSDAQVNTLYELACVLGVVAVTGVVYFLALSMLLAQRQWVTGAWVASIAVALHAVVILAGPSDTATAVAVCHAIASALSALLAAGVLLREEISTLGHRLLRRGVPIALLTAVIPLTRFLLGWDLSLASALVGAALGSALYLGGIWFLRRPLELNLRAP